MLTRPARAGASAAPTTRRGCSTSRGEARASSCLLRSRLPLIAIVVILLSCLCLCLTWCVCHEVARRERLIDTAAKTRRRQMSSMDELRRQTSVDRLSTLAENSVEGSNPGEVAVEVRGDSGGTLKVSSAI